MQTDQQRLLWVLKFIETNLAQLRPGAFMDLQTDLTTFCGFPILEDRETLQEVQRHTLGVLTDFAAGPKPPPLNMLEGIEEQQVYRSFDFSFEKGASISICFYANNRGAFDASGMPFPERFRFALGLVFLGIHRAGLLDRFRACIECNKPFFAEYAGRTFCSVTCKGRAASRRHRESHRGSLRSKAHVFNEKAKAKRKAEQLTPRKKRKVKAA